jgi:hypothetical protein
MEERVNSAAASNTRFLQSGNGEGGNAVRRLRIPEEGCWRQFGLRLLGRMLLDEPDRTIDYCRVKPKSHRWRHHGSR